MINKSKLSYIVLLSFILNLLVNNNNVLAVSAPSADEQYYYRSGYEKYNSGWTELSSVYYSATNNSITILDEVWANVFGTWFLSDHKNTLILNERETNVGSSYYNYLRKFNGSLRLGNTTLLSINHSVPSNSTKKIEYVIPGGTTAIGLSPNTTYSMTLSYDVEYWDDRPGQKIIKTGNFNSRIPALGGYNDVAYYMYTDVSIPIISFNDIKDKKIGITLNTMGNPATTEYTIERRMGNNPWQVIASKIKVNSFIDESSELKPENTYQYRVLTHHTEYTRYGLTSRDKYTNIYSVTTTADPAVAAAQEAASKAQAAKEAADRTLQYSEDAKNAAETVRQKIEHPEYGLEALASQIGTPFIQSIKSPTEYTFTLGDTFDLVINAIGVPDKLRYRVICDDFDSGWLPTDKITITGLSENGIKKATVMVSNNPYTPEKGVIAKDEFKFFKASF